MTSATDPFGGFPGIGKATAIPNLFFTAVLPKLESPAALLAFLWVARLVQEQRTEARCVSNGDIWANDFARKSFEQLAEGRASLDAGLLESVRAGALLGLDLSGATGRETVFFVNNPGSRRAVTRARSGALEIRPETSASPLEMPEARPGIFRLYEEHIGTITPMIGDRLAEAESTYPAEWIEDAFREAAELNIRNWRYIERILRTWTEEGRPDETAGRDSFEDQKRRFLGGSLGHVVRYR
ncbi:MAG TPA: DnaD domain protein [Tepidiformaceae bacterium]|nr:DnaD domain protein [Tepidiformaceae bacterium]